MKKCLLIVIGILVVLAVIVSIPASATDLEVNEGTSVFTSTEEGTLNIDEDIAGEIVDIVEGSESKADAIILIASKLGVTVEEAENIVDTIIEAGDKYLGESAWWISFKDDLVANRNFWTTVVLCILCVIAILIMIFVFAVKVVPTLNKSNFGANKLLDLSAGMKEENSQTLVKIEEMAALAAEKDEVYNKLLAEKEEHIEKLVEKISEMKAAAEKERRSMVLAETYNLHKFPQQRFRILFQKPASHFPKKRRTQR